VAEASIIDFTYEKKRTQEHMAELRENASGLLDIEYKLSSHKSPPMFTCPVDHNDDIDCDIPSEKSEHVINAADFKYNLAS
jgi:hypothetical protein